MHHPFGPAAARPLPWIGLACALLAGQITLAPTAAAAEARAFVTASGERVALDPVSGLDCRGLDAKLAEIDRTGFRGNGPVPLDAHDEPLYRYEREVANALYTRCAGNMSGAEAAAAMRRGFRQE